MTVNFKDSIPASNKKQHQQMDGNIFYVQGLDSFKALTSLQIGFEGESLFFSTEFLGHRQNITHLTIHYFLPKIARSILIL